MRSVFATAVKSGQIQGRGNRFVWVEPLIFWNHAHEAGHEPVFVGAQQFTKFKLVVFEGSNI